MRAQWWILGGIIGLALTVRRRPLSPVVGRVSSPFHDPERGEHNGTDIAVPVGTPVVAPEDGTVILANYTTAGGHQLRLKLSTGHVVGFAHLSKRMVNEGDTVQRGQTVALSGNTGRTTGPHVHVTLIDPNGERIDPASYFTFS